MCITDISTEATATDPGQPRLFICSDARSEIMQRITALMIGGKGHRTAAVHACDPAAYRLLRGRSLSPSRHRGAGGEFIPTATTMTASMPPTVALRHTDNCSSHANFTRGHAGRFDMHRAL